MNSVCLWPAIAALSLMLGPPTNAPSMRDPEWILFSQRVKALRDSRQKDEHIALFHYGGGYKRHVQTWVKVSPAYRTNGTWARKLTVFVDDTSGYRVRTVPNEVKVSVKFPARVLGAERKRTSNGEATFEVAYAPGQQVAAVLVVTVPPIAGAHLDLPLRANPPGPRHPVTLNERHAEELLQMAQKVAKEGERQWASRELFARAELFLLAGQHQRAAGAFAECEAQYPESRWAVLCAYGQWLALSEAEETGRAKEVAARLVAKYPRSIPAQFVTRQPDELWDVPYYGHGMR